MGIIGWYGKHPEYVDYHEEPEEPVEDGLWGESSKTGRKGKKGGPRLPYSGPRIRSQADLDSYKDELDHKLAAGEMSELAHELEYDYTVRRAQCRLDSELSLAEAGLSFEDLGSLSDDYDQLIREASSDLDFSRYAEGIEAVVDRRGAEEAQEIADVMREEDRLSDEAHEYISRKIEGKR